MSIVLEYNFVLWEESVKAVIALAIFFGSLLSGCSSESAPQAALLMQEIKGREFEGVRLAVYRVQIPSEWMRRDPLPTESLIDTTKALCEFLIQEESEGFIRISIHNFPTETIEQRISPSAQVSRWQKQFAPLYATESSTTPVAFSGFSGLSFIGRGLLDGKESMVLGWTLQIAPDHYHALSHPPLKNSAALYKQMRADVTIKAVGPRGLMEKYQASIHSFARSFELIEEIPKRS